MGGGGGGKSTAPSGLETCIGNKVGKSTPDSIRARAVWAPRGVVGGGGGKFVGRGMLTLVSDRTRVTLNPN
jgi:hypothetical protein